MAGLMLVVAAGAFLAACYTPWELVTCDNAGIIALVEAWIAAIVANQAAHLVFKKA
jgi:hypothetical protein